MLIKYKKNDMNKSLLNYLIINFNYRFFQKKFIFVEMKKKMLRIASSLFTSKLKNTNFLITNLINTSFIKKG